VTLIITIISKNKVVQVSDCLLTLNGKEHDANAIKAIGVACTDAQFCLGYAGVGEIEGQRTDYWLVDQIDSIFSSGRQDVRSLTWELAVRAEEAMPKLTYRGVPVKREDRVLKLVMAGYHHGDDGPLSQPFITSISNTRFRGYEVPLGMEPVFTIYPGTLRPGIADNEYTGSITGTIPAIMAGDNEYAKDAYKELQQVMRQLKRVDLGERPSGKTTAERLVSVIRQVSRHPKHGQLIGRDCLSVVIHPTNPRCRRTTTQNRGAP
jgi:hypothetical protein